ncbi:MAG: hypothetical protein FWF51_06385 [Chitinivibrionia bacterium]|nr:hypothetical protein [Chitinivibrionia bacterium]
MKKNILSLLGGALLMSLFFAACGDDEEEETGGYALHTNIMATTFWAGEEADDDNGFISNIPSAWDSQWGDHYTVNGVTKEDAPTVNRDGDFFPIGYDGTENVYYFALPYDDRSRIVFEDEDASTSKIDAVVALDKTNYTKSGKKVNTTAYSESRKENAKKIPWYNTESNWKNKSVVKARWVKVRSTDQGSGGQKGNGEWVYAQWLDAGPFHYDDFKYVFGNSRPRNENEVIGVKSKAGIDLSPAVMFKMGFSKNEMQWGGINRIVEWQFVDNDDVPDGPWKRVVSNNGMKW